MWIYIMKNSKSINYYIFNIYNVVVKLVLFVFVLIILWIEIGIKIEIRKRSFICIIM